MLRIKVGRRIAVGFAGLVLVAAVLAPAALGHPSAKAPKLVGNPKAGKSTFLSTCGTCHTLAAAKTTGAIGPNLNKVKPALTEAKIITAITKGGASVMTAAARKKYAVTMSSFASLGKTTIDNVAAYVYSSTHPS